MMGKFVPFKAWHAMDIIASNSALIDPIVFQSEIAQSIEDIGGSFSYIVGDDIVACGGVFPQWPGRLQAWMFLTPGSEKHMMSITRRIKDTLEVTPGRIEMTVIKDFEKGHKWAKILGFEVETPVLRAYGPAGEDHVGYVRIS